MPKTRLAFFVPGIPAPKGSWRAIVPKGSRRAFLKNDNKGTKAWAEAVTVAAIVALGGRPAQPYRGVVRLVLAYSLHRPKTLPKRVEDHVKKPDLDKLDRTIFDALTKAGVYQDDSQVNKRESWKNYAGPLGPGVWIEVHYD